MALESVRLVREGARQAGRDDVVVAFACRTQDWPADQQEKARGYDGYYVPLDMENYLKPLADLLANADAESKPDMILMEIQSWIPGGSRVPRLPGFPRHRDSALDQPTGARSGNWSASKARRSSRMAIVSAWRRGSSRRWAQRRCWSIASRRARSPESETWLRHSHKLPLGAYPNMGKYLTYEWDWSTCETPAQILRWRRAGRGRECRSSAGAAAPGLRTSALWWRASRRRRQSSGRKWREGGSMG